MMPAVIIMAVSKSKSLVSFWHNQKHYIVKSFIVLVVLNTIILSPYVLNNYFEARMMVVTFALGMAFWGYWLGKLLIEFGILNKLRSVGVLGIAIGFLVVFSVGSPVPVSIRKSYLVTQELISITQELNSLNYKKIGIVNFPSAGGLLRNGNAKGVIRYISNREIEIINNLTFRDNLSNYDYPIIEYHDDPDNPFKVHNFTKFSK